MEKFSRESEDRLVSVLRDVTHLVHQGDHPTDAIVKVARQEQLPASCLPLVVQGYNVGRAAHQREKAAGQGILDRLAPFDVARIEDVKEALYPGSPEAPVKQASRTAVAECYAKPAAMTAGATLLDYAREKTAGAAGPGVLQTQGVGEFSHIGPAERASKEELEAFKRVHPNYDKLTEEQFNPEHGAWLAHVRKFNKKFPATEAQRTEETGQGFYHPALVDRVLRHSQGQLKKADVYSQAEKAAQALELARAAAMNGRDAMLGSLTKLADYFRSYPTGRLAFDEVAYNASRVFGKAAEAALTYCCHTLPDLVKEAATFVPPGQPVFADREPYSLVKAVLDAGQRAIKCAGELVQAKEQLAAAQAALPYKSAGLAEMTNTLTHGAPDAPPLKPVSELVAGKTRELDDPSHLNEIHRIRTQAMLTDLMANDEVPLQSKCPPSWPSSHGACVVRPPHGPALHRNRLRLLPMVRSNNHGLERRVRILVRFCTFSLY